MKSGRNYVMAGALAAVAALSVQGVVRTYRIYQEGLDSEIRRKKAALLRCERLASQKNIAEQLTRQASAYRAAGSAEEESARFLKEAEKLARQASLSVHHMKPQAASRKDPYWRLTVDLELAGPVENLTGFMIAAERSIGGMKILKFGLSAAGDSRANPTGRFTLTRLIVSR